MGRNKKRKTVPPDSANQDSNNKKQKTENKEQTKPKKQPDRSYLSNETDKRITQIIKQFRDSDENECMLDESLKNHERALAHKLCHKMGLKSKSQGNGENRRIFIYKRVKASSKPEAKEKLYDFNFSEKSKGVLQDLFSRCPPNDAEMTEYKIGETSGKPYSAQMGDDMFLRPSMKPSEIVNKLETLSSKIEKSPALQKIAEARSKLPIASFKDNITSLIQSNQVVLICGETGCGKTTQVPQFLLDHAWSKGESCKIVCTQPRRISAISVAERIASERGEKVGDSVGYKIRLESKGGRQSSIVFCTNGVLLKVLVNKGICGTVEKASKGKHNGLLGITHIIMDEIHERDSFSDFILAMIRDLLPAYPHLRLVMMSATINAERFSQYFGGSPILRVPGFTFPVKTYYLEDVLSIVESPENKHTTSTESIEATEESRLTDDCRFSLDEAIDLALSNDEFDPLIELLSSKGDLRVFNRQHSQTGLTPLMVFGIKGRVGDICMLLSSGIDCNLRCNAGKTALDYAQGESAEIIRMHMEKAITHSKDVQQLLDKYFSKAHPEMLDCALIEQLLMRICEDSKEGAILVFLPGWDDINKMQDRLLGSPFFKDTSKFRVLSLHSMVPSEEQRKVFDRPPDGCRKIVLSTNIAETSVTIDDVVYVVDSGRMKEKSYDPHNNVSTLLSCWISKASAKQREGRGGRCQPGICYHLYTKHFEASLPEFSVPEIKRMPVEELCLQVRLIDRSCKIEDFLQKLLDPPVNKTIRNGITVLQEIGALTTDEKLTDLGEKLGYLPVHPRTSKMLLVAILLNCLDPALTLACAADYRDPFILPINPQDKIRAQAARSDLALYGGIGDQLTVVAAFNFWRIAKQNGQGVKKKFCSRYLVSGNTMHMISGMRKQLEAELVRCGLIEKDAHPCNINAQDQGIVHAILVAALYPKIGRMVPVRNRSLIEMADGSKVRLHHRSIIAGHKTENSDTPLVAFDEITRGDGGMYIKKCSLIGPLPLLLLASEIVVAPLTENGCGNDNLDSHTNSQQDKKIMSSPEDAVKVIVDKWLHFESTALDAAHIYCLRERLSAALLHKITYPRKHLPPHLDLTLRAIACILSFDGMSGISLSTNSLEPSEKSETSLNSNSLQNSLPLPRFVDNTPLVSQRPDTKHTPCSSAKKKKKRKGKKCISN